MALDSQSILFGLFGGRDEPGTVLTNRQLLGQRLFINSQIRFLVAVIFMSGGLCARYIAGLSALNTVGLITLGAIIAFYNTGVFLLVRRLRKPERSQAAFRLLRRIMYVAVVLDFLGLAVAIRLLGGSHSPFMAFYVLHVILCCAMLARRAAVVFTVLAFLLVVAQVVVDWWQILPDEARATSITSSRDLGALEGVVIISVYGSLFALISMLLIPIIEWLRRDERSLRDANAQLNRLSSLRRDFMHIASHNMKAPVGVALTMLDNLQNGLAGELNEKQSDWVQRSSTRLNGLLDFMRDLRLLADLELEEINPNTETADLNEILRDLVEEYRDAATERGLGLSLVLDHELPTIPGIDRLLREAIVNYITNAIRFTPSGGRVTLQAQVKEGIEGRVVRVNVADTGPGIPAESRDRLFTEFARIQSGPSSGDSRLGGTGLGLSLVKRIVEVHGGTVGVHSVHGEGSDFFLELPLRRESPLTSRSDDASRESTSPPE